jgi:hypothetical protein
MAICGGALLAFGIGYGLLLLLNKMAKTPSQVTTAGAGPQQRLQQQQLAGAVAGSPIAVSHLSGQLDRTPNVVVAGNPVIMTAPQQILATVPPGAQPGTTIPISTPSGILIAAVVPTGAIPGSHFFITVK